VPVVRTATVADAPQLLRLLEQSAEANHIALDRGRACAAIMAALDSSNRRDIIGAIGDTEIEAAAFLRIDQQWHCSDFHIELLCHLVRTDCDDRSVGPSTSTECGQSISLQILALQPVVLTKRRNLARKSRRLEAAIRSVREATFQQPRRAAAARVAKDHAAATAERLQGKIDRMRAALDEAK
jgi:hypothetical protein